MKTLVRVALALAALLLSPAALAQTVCVASASVDSCASGGGITIGTTPITGGATTQVLFNLAGVVSSDAGFTYDATLDTATLGALAVGTTTTAGTATSRLDAAMGGGSAIDNFLNITGTMPTVLTADGSAALISVTGAGSSAFSQYGLSVNLEAGYTGTTSTAAARFRNSTVSAGSAISSVVYGVYSEVAGAYGAGTNDLAIALFGDGTTANDNLINVGAWGKAASNSSVYSGIGVVGQGPDNASNTPAYGGVFTLNASGTFAGNVLVPFVSGRAGLAASNGATTADSLQIYDNATEVLAVGDGGNYRFYRTMTAAGTTGAQTINKPAGSVNFAAAATTLVVTNSLATTTSLILLTPMTNDTTCKTFTVTRAAGSFTATASAACTAETALAFLVVN